MAKQALATANKARRSMPYQGGLHARQQPVKRRTYIRIDPRFIRVCVTCKRKNARVQIVPMTRDANGTIQLNKKEMKSRSVTVCDRKTCIARAIEKKQFQYWLKLPIGQDVKSTVLAH